MLDTTLTYTNSTTTKSLRIDVKCLYDKNSILSNQQITWGTKNITYGDWPENNFQIIGWGSFENLFRLEGPFTNDLYSELKSSTSLL